SSRRRHTRFSRDWSSDVCSSDLSHSFNHKTAVMALITGLLIASTYAFSPAPAAVVHGEHENNLKVLPKDISHDELMQVMHSFERSEERRVGKEWRCRGARERS